METLNVINTLLRKDLDHCFNDKQPYDWIGISLTYSYSIQSEIKNPQDPSPHHSIFQYLFFLFKGQHLLSATIKNGK